MSHFNEHTLEMAIMELYEQQGYCYVNGETIHKELSEVLLRDDLRMYLMDRYAQEGITFLEREDASLPDLFVEVIDFKDVDKNIFKIVNQLEIKGLERRIPDGIVYVNGLPVVVLEFKSAVKTDATIMNAFTPFYDILKEIAHKFGFEYPEDKLLTLAAAVKKMVDDKSKYTDWANRSDIKAELQMDLILILAEHGYPPVPQDEVFKEIFEQAENFKKYEQADEEDTAKVAPTISIYPHIEEEEGMMMAAEDIFIYGSIPVDLPHTKREELTNGKLDLILMYAIGSGARQKTEAAGKIALGIKESMLKDEQMAAYKIIKYLMFHYWSNPMAYLLTQKPMLVDKDTVPSDYLIRMEKDAVKFLLLNYNPQQFADLGIINILKTQRRGEIRYLPFVTTVDSIIDE